MHSNHFKPHIINLLKKWWATLFILPFAIYSTHQIYWALNYNIFFALNYEYPFPVNIIHFFVDNFLLIVHEAGHTFLGIFGLRFLTILGGSLFQIILPLLIVTYCRINHQKAGTQLSLCLAGYSLFDVAAYAADGGAQQLPLIGGLGTEAHDWYNLLRRINALEHDITFAIVFTALGLLCYITALIYPLFSKSYDKGTLNLKLK